MFTTESELRFSTSKHLKSGVALSRYDITLRDYLERQERLAVRRTPVSVPSTTYLIELLIGGFHVFRAPATVMVAALRRIARSASAWSARLVTTTWH